jgi:hypothetical protein
MFFNPSRSIKVCQDPRDTILVLDVVCSNPTSRPYYLRNDAWLRN